MRPAAAAAVNRQQSQSSGLRLALCLPQPCADKPSGTCCRHFPAAHPPRWPLPPPHPLQPRCRRCSSRTCRTPPPSMQTSSTTTSSSGAIYAACITTWCAMMCRCALGWAVALGIHEHIQRSLSVDLHLAQFEALKRLWPPPNPAPPAAPSPCPLMQLAALQHLERRAVPDDKLCRPARGLPPSELLIKLYTISCTQLPPRIANAASLLGLGGQHVAGTWRCAEGSPCRTSLCERSRPAR